MSCWLLQSRAAWCSTCLLYTSYAAHAKLEEITLDKETSHYKNQVALKFGELVYNGQWYTPLRKALSAFVDSTQETVTGYVKLKLYKGNIIPG